MIARLFETSDPGPHPFPQHCPAWCDQQVHRDFAGDSSGCYAAAEITTHYRSGGDTCLDKIRSPVTHEITKDRGAG